MYFNIQYFKCLSRNNLEAGKEPGDEVETLWAHVFPPQGPSSPTRPPPAEWRSGRWRMGALLLSLGICHLGKVYKGLKQANNGVLNKSSDPKKFDSHMKY